MSIIGILSDTHDLLRPSVREALSGCDAIVHAGDFTSEALLDELGRLAPFYGVQGNNDRCLAHRLNPVLRFQIAGMCFAMAHEKRNIPRDLTGVDIVIFGHSHKFFQEEIDGRLWLNPGGCGRRRFGQELTMARLFIEKEKYFVQKIEIPFEE